ncbi:hypothetical protein PDN73_31555 [Bacillus cereus]|nr:hypothetical protein [Bacillus cereus]
MEQNLREEISKLSNEDKLYIIQTLKNAGLITMEDDSDIDEYFTDSKCEDECFAGYVAAIIACAFSPFPEACKLAASIAYQKCLDNCPDDKNK